MKREAEEKPRRSSAAPRARRVDRAPPPPETLPVLALKNTVLFPNLIAPLSVGRPRSIAAVRAAIETEEKTLFLLAQRDAAVEIPGPDDLHRVGTRAVIKRMATASPEVMQIVVQGVERARVVEFSPAEDHLRAVVAPVEDPADTSIEVEALHREILEMARKAASLVQGDTPFPVASILAATEDPLRVSYLLASLLGLEVEKEQALLEAPTRREALRLLHGFLTHSLQVLELRGKIASRAQAELTKQQRDYVLREQMKAIQQELGESEPQAAEGKLLRQRLDEANLAAEVRKEAERELSRLERLPPQSPEYNVIRTYLEFVLDLPWNQTTEDALDLAHARAVLDEDHHDLEDVKKRILEHLAVLKLNPDAKAPILCFVGPPGVGKTSLGQSIARAIGRKFERMSLGGVHDEAELRGHRRTYVGAMPGRILQAIRRAGVRNPLVMLDEVDKLGRDFRGDPAAALLEVLDPEQNSTFRDHYLDLPFDLSKVFFITTANTTETIPPPLLDRMEGLRLTGYSEEEKIEIAKRYLLPRQLRETGLGAERASFEDETLKRIISRYTREAGVRQLERTIARVARRLAVRYAEGKAEPTVVKPDDLAEILGPESFLPERLRRELPAGVAPGLAWTETGGEVLYVEATVLPEGEGLTLTGQLGQVMQESARAAQSYVWSHARALGIDAARFKKRGVHIHVPAGATPKDGPSAGVTMATALASIYTERPARSDTAMTGEISLTGLVLPVGGMKEKILAARRAGLRRVILPRENEKDLRDLPAEVRAEMEFVFADRIEDVLESAIGAPESALPRGEPAPIGERSRA